jgi:uncharacterized surface protein with fasciclin (FAS1) repeats
VRQNNINQLTGVKLIMKNIGILSLVAAAMVVNLSNVVRADSCSTGTTAVSACAAKKDIVAVASGSEQFKTLVAAVKAAGLVEVLQGEGPFTVFAPTDEAFGKLPAGTVEGLLKPENREKLVAILKYHVVPGKVMAADVKPGKVKTAQGQSITVKASDGIVRVDDARVIKTDVMADNGVIHVIDSVILPES